MAFTHVLVIHLSATPFFSCYFKRKQGRATLDGYVQLQMVSLTTISRAALGSAEFFSFDSCVWGKVVGALLGSMAVAVG